jgi:hypothetical protein
MTKAILFPTLLLSFALAGCGKTDGIDPPLSTASRLVFRVGEATKADDGTPDGGVLFTGDDILWFQESTGEIRFENNISQKEIIQGVLDRSIRFYIDDEYLFSSMICVSDLHSQVYNSLVFYYSQIENRFYLKDGYPDVSVLHDSARQQSLRDANMAGIQREWERFTNCLKAENRWK